MDQPRFRAVLSEVGSTPCIGLRGHEISRRRSVFVPQHSNAQVQTVLSLPATDVRSAAAAARAMTTRLDDLKPDALVKGLVGGGRQWSFAGSGDLFRLVSEAERIQLAYLFDRDVAVSGSS